MLRHLRTRRRPRCGAHICAVIAAVLLLLSVSLLYSRLSFFNSHPQHSHPLPHDYLSFNPLLDDLDSDPLTTSNSNEDRIDEFDDAILDNNNNNEEILPDEEEEDVLQNQNSAVTSNYFFDHVNGVVRRSFNRRSIEEWEDYVPFNLKLSSDLGFGTDDSKPVFGSDDILVDEKLRKKLSEVKRIEDALLLKGSVLRDGWGEWFDKKGDFLRRDRMFKSNIEVLNPLNNPILQDPDGPGVTGLTRGDRIYLKGILNEFKRTPFLVKKPLAISESEIGFSREKGGIDGKEVKRLERRTLDNDYIRQVRSNEGLENVYYADGKRWGYYPGLDGSLSFGNFMNAFFRKGKCKMRVFMVWNSPVWMFGVRQQRGLESLLNHHRDACVVVFSETMELNFFSGFVKDGYKVAVVMPNLDELLRDTPTHIFASVWHEWKKTKHYATHYSELIRLAALYKYGGVYLDSDVIVLKALSELNNTIGLEDEAGETLNGAVMAFRKHSPFVMECLAEYYASYDDAQLRWNGADLLTRVAKKFLSNKAISNTKTELQLRPSSVFFPIRQNIISRYFTAPGTETEKLEQDVQLNKILNESVTVHFWNSLTSAVIPESESLVFRLLNRALMINQLSTFTDKPQQGL
ncbi:Alpha-1,4-N-acetylglucosaminyltransferase [Handroanthus impetiginosus]|uniref:Alpha-1,4-N-acetylglucosaminyltransferase n=1 Tax=Handroanthus impetiginosus TaxID=429701 RepID=A0A2G9I4W7_9LAMI|nr:Alpha-1,4-N-acetylglucosaminyltransferase [Handroanthus impetiginosus]